MLLRAFLAVEQARLRSQLQNIISKHDVIVTAIKKKSGLLERLSREGIDLIIAGQSFLPEPIIETLKLMQQLPDSPEIVLVYQVEDPERRARLLAAGCDAVLYGGLAPDAIEEVLATIIQKRRKSLLNSLTARRPLAQPSLNDFVSSSPAMQAFLGMVRRVVQSDSSILILGETGVGKERLARAIHAESPRSGGPFIAVNCGALPETLLESELFGHEQGAFTGATRSRRGWFELAHRGTIFLDEIGEMPKHLQVKLLRVLQEKKIQRVGSERDVEIDVRIMAASNRDLAAEVEAKNFRRDLYYRLCVVALMIPPLRDRKADIPVLVESYIHYLRLRIAREVYSISEKAMELLCQYSWPGNVRELINVIERAILLCTGDTITVADLPEEIRGNRGSAARSLSLSRTDALPEEWLKKPLEEVRREFLDQFERTYLRGLLQQTSGRISETARRAGIQPRSLFDKMKRHGLRKEDFRVRPD